MPVFYQVGTSASPVQGRDFHRPPGRRLWKTLSSTSLLRSNYKDHSSPAKAHIANNSCAPPAATKPSPSGSAGLRPAPRPPPAVNRTAGRSRLPSRNCTSTAILDLTKGIFTMLEANSRRLRRHRASTCSPTRYSPLRRRRRTFRADHLIMLAPYRFAAKNPEPLCYVRMCSNAATVRSENGAGGTHRVQRHRLHQIPIEDR